MIKWFLVSVFFLTVTGLWSQEISSSKKRDSKVENQIDSLINIMTLREKVGQLVLYNGSWDVTGPPSDLGSQDKFDKLKKGEVGAMLNVTSVAATREAQRAIIENSRLKIPLIFGYDVIHGFKTMFPTPLAESASWDLKAMESSARIAAEEASAACINWTFAPMVDLSRDARWGRIMEGAGEDPYLGAKIAVARINGFQGDDLTAKTTIAACAKHFAAYGLVEAGRDYNTVSVGEFMLHNQVLPPFKAAVDAGVMSFMSSFNEIDGIPATASTLQRDLLKRDWNFDGFVVSDWASIAEMIFHGYAKNNSEAAELAINAGNDMDMEGRVFEDSLEKLVASGKVASSTVDDAVRRILRAKFRLGLFEDPYRYCNEDREKTAMLTSENLEISRDVARKSVVLLKNEKQLLPLSKKVKSIAVIGALADDKDSPIGSWRAMATPNSAVSLLEGIKSAVSSKTTVRYEKGVDVGIGDRDFKHELKLNRTNFNGIEAAVKLAKTAEVVVIALGEEAFQSGEGRSQVSIDLTAPQQRLLEAIQKVNKKVVLVLMNGRPLAIPFAADNIPAIVEGWHLGSASGTALADVLFGDYNPSGKLPVSFPRHTGQSPLYYNHKSTGRPYSADPTMVFWSHYTDEQNTALFPFGFGLSYTEFGYENLVVSAPAFSKGGSVEVSVTVRNKGKFQGREVVQLYIRDLFGSITRPVKELKGFELIDLAPGESKKVSFTISEETIQFYTANRRIESEKGDFKVFVGGNSRDVLEGAFTYN